ncbi:DNA polymerase III subunit beta [Clostridium formicaceticum]|uniref:Beta sliding clamp n=1 Tax=Clostridium formicaceticum TaxID=1497 RepID=A0AAC9WF72_9CLOT|nr:DNA polymerase III subunit beta [Clostridium formicaceticum]AOY75417.1 DNA polymerase III subunit beta [Clostridium formicaceticum]ARE85695.1 DNA polymerase III subunit beta [Clostridium formicaceticum]
MRFLCEKKTLVHSISIVQKAVSSKTTLPILKGIHIEVIKDYLKLVATDLEIGIEHTVEVNTYEEGSVVVDARLFSEIIRKLPDAEVEIILKENNQLYIKCENSEFNIICYDPQDFPELPSIEEEYSYEIHQDLFKNMIRQTVFAASQDETRLVLTGALMEIEENTLNMVALDGYRLALRKGKIDASIDNKVILPAKALNEINRILTDEEETIHITLTENHALFIIGNTKLISRLLEGEFISYKQIIPKEYKSKVRVKTKSLLDSIERASLLAREGKNNLVKFMIDDDKMTISSNSELGKVQEEVAIYLEGESIEIAFNSKYFIDALKIIEDEEVYLEFTTNLSPGILKPVTNDYYIYLVLPVRLSAN